MFRGLMVLVSLLGGPACDAFDNEVNYTLSGSDLECPNADDTSYFSSGSYASFTCTWLCATYKGDGCQYVSLTFVNQGSRWQLDSEYVSSGICN